MTDSILNTLLEMPLEEGMIQLHQNLLSNLKKYKSLFLINNMPEIIYNSLMKVEIK